MMNCRRPKAFSCRARSTLTSCKRHRTRPRLPCPASGATLIFSHFGASGLALPPLIRREGGFPASCSCPQAPPATTDSRLDKGRLPRIEQIKSHQAANARRRRQVQKLRIAVKARDLPSVTTQASPMASVRPSKKVRVWFCRSKRTRPAMKAKMENRPASASTARHREDARKSILQLPDSGADRSGQQCGKRERQHNGDPARSRSRAGHLISTAFRHLAPIPESTEYRRFRQFRIPLHSIKIYGMVPQLREFL